MNCTELSPNMVKLGTCRVSCIQTSLCVSDRPVPIVFDQVSTHHPLRIEFEFILLYVTDTTWTHLILGCNKVGSLFRLSIDQ